MNYLTYFSYKGVGHKLPLRVPIFYYESNRKVMNNCQDEFHLMFEREV